MRARHPADEVDLDNVVRQLVAWVIECPDVDPATENVLGIESLIH